MAKQDSERIVLKIPVNFTVDDLAGFCKASEEQVSELLEDALDLFNSFAAPKAILRWANVESITGDSATINGSTFHSKVVADKLKDSPRVFLSVITAGTGLEKCGKLKNDSVILNMLNGALIYYAVTYVIGYMKEQFGFDGSSMLNPGSLPDWPIANNFQLFKMVGNPGEIGVSLDEKGYITPWNSTSSIHFPGDGYHNCSLCKKYDCIGRRAPFDRDEYIRIFGMEP